MKTFIINDLFSGETYKLSSETYEEAYLEVCKYLLNENRLNYSNLEEFKTFFSDLDCDVKCLDDIEKLVDE